MYGNQLRISLSIKYKEDIHEFLNEPLVEAAIVSISHVSKSWIYHLALVATKLKVLVC